MRKNNSPPTGGFCFTLELSQKTCYYTPIYTIYLGFMEMHNREIPPANTGPKRKLDPHGPEQDHALEGTPIDNILVMLALKEMDIETAVRVIQSDAHRPPFISTSRETFANMDMLREILKRFQGQEITKNQALTLVETQLSNARERLTEEETAATQQAQARQRQHTIEQQTRPRPEIPVANIEQLEREGWAPIQPSKIDDWQGTLCPFPVDTVVSLLRVRPTEDGDDVFLYKTSDAGPQRSEEEGVEPFVFIVKDRTYRRHTQAESQRTTTMIPAQQLPGDVWVAKLRDITRVRDRGQDDRYEPVLRSWKPVDDDTIQRWFQRAYVPELNFVRFVTILSLDNPDQPGKRLRFFMESRNQPDAELEERLATQNVRQMVCRNVPVQSETRDEISHYILLPTANPQSQRLGQEQTAQQKPANESLIPPELNIGSTQPEQSAVPRTTAAYFDEPFSRETASSDELTTAEIEEVMARLDDAVPTVSAEDVLIGDQLIGEPAQTDLGPHPRRADNAPDHTRLRVRRADESLKTATLDIGHADTLEQRFGRIPSDAPPAMDADTPDAPEQQFG